MNGEVEFRAHKLAVLIDADNSQPNLIEPLLKEIAKYGNAHVKRIYGDWTSSALSGWKEKLNQFSIQPIQQFAYTKGKNATDSALIIDAMDLLYTQNFDGFCLVSSDSDFTRLASRIREAGLVVYGFGKKQTPQAFISACDKFIYTEILYASGEVKALAQTGAGVSTSLLDKGENWMTIPDGQRRLDDMTILIPLLSLLKDAYEATPEQDGWVELGVFGIRLTQIYSDFDSRIYGYKQLKKLIKAVQVFDIRETPQEKNPDQKMTHIKWKYPLENFSDFCNAHENCPRPT
jgi:uncharacterized LabA/DUF88 family protein